MKRIAFSDGEQVKSVLYILAIILILYPVSILAQPVDPDSGSAVQITVDTVMVDRCHLTTEDFRRSEAFFPRRVGLALSGGGARGLAQIGVLKAFDEAGLEISYIAGSSMGSIIGGLYAAGYSADSIESIVHRVDFSTLFSNSPQWRSLFFAQREEKARYLFTVRFNGFYPYIPRALTAGQRLTSFLTDLTIRADYDYGGDFNRLPIPFRAVATDIASGSKVVLSHGSLADAMRASMAFPLAFTPVDIQGRYLIDGGIVDPIPVHECRQMGADYVVAVNTTSQLLPADKIEDPITIAGQVTTIMSQNALAEQLRAADYIIRPRMKNYELFDFGMHDSLVTLGYTVGRRAVADIINQLSRSPIDGGLILDSIGIARDDPMLESLRRNFPITPGQNCRLSEIDAALRYADADINFHTLRALVTQRDHRLSVVLDGTPNKSYDDISYRIIGNTVLPDSDLTVYFPPPGDSIVSLRSVHRAADSIITRLRHQGYDLAHINAIEYDQESGVVTVSIDEGILKYVDIRGNNRTRSWIIKANYPLRPGQPFDVRQSEKGLANIYATGFFERVSLDIKPTEEGVHLTINVREKKFTELRLGAHWDDEYQAEMFGELLDDNILGAGIQALAHAQIGSRRKIYYLSFKVDRFPTTLITARTRFYFSRLRRRLFYSDGAPNGYRIEDRLGWSFLIGQNIARLGAIDLQYRLEDINTRLTMTDQKRDHALSAFTISSVVETLNKFPYPDYGHRQEITLEFTSKWLGGTFDEYTKLWGSLEAYAPLGKYINFHPRFAAGISTANLPDVEKYFLGGMYNFSGYRTDQLAGDKYFLANLQLRIKLPYACYLLGNYDFGNVFDDYENIKIEDFRQGYGAALSIDSPLGPVDFGYGKAEDMPWRLYFNFGLRF
jgi:NTE family protein